MSKLHLAALTASLVLGLAPVQAEERAIRFGEKLPNLTFKDIRYLPRSLDDFGKKKAYVLVFTSTGCPIVERYLPILQKLETVYRAQDVQFLAVNVGADDSILAMATQAV